MIIKWLSINPRMPFRKKVVLKIWASALFMLLGALAICALFYTGSFIEEGDDGSFRNGFYTGVGFGLFASGIVTVIQCVRLLKNAEKFRAAEISDSDERARFIVAQSGMWVIFCMCILLFAGTIIAGIYNYIVFNTLLSVMGVFGLLLIICYTVARKMY